MRILKCLLAFIYIVLIILLVIVISGVRGCTPEQHATHDATDIGGNGDLKITLLWNFPGDIDLHVATPSGQEVYYEHPTDSHGGKLDVDNRSGGQGAAENVYWTHPPHGVYKVGLHYYDASQYNHQAGSGECTVVVFQKGYEPRTYRVSMSKVHEKKMVTTVNVQ